MMPGGRRPFGRMPTIATEGSPNIVVVMNESFSDLTTYLEGYETSTDPMPYVRSLTNRGDVVSGTCAVSSGMGTGTANSEFEFLTGNSMAYFKGNTPYVQFIDAETPSLASLLAGRGYSTMAMHAYERAGYNRVKVYDRLGFETYKGIEDFDVDLDYARGYPTDEANYRQLISYFETVDEPTVVLFFGDHEPRLSNEFYSSWFTDENDLDLETTAQLHKTPLLHMGQLQSEHRIDPEGFGGFTKLSVYGFVPDGRGAAFAIPGILGGSSHGTPGNYGSIPHYRIRRQGWHGAFGVHRFDP